MVPVDWGWGHTCKMFKIIIEVLMGLWSLINFYQFSSCQLPVSTCQSSKVAGLLYQAGRQCSCVCTLTLVDFSIYYTIRKVWHSPVFSYTSGYILHRSKPGRAKHWINRERWVHTEMVQPDSDKSESEKLLLKTSKGPLETGYFENYLLQSKGRLVRV